VAPVPPVPQTKAPPSPMHRGCGFRLELGVPTAKRATRRPRPSRGPGPSFSADGAARVQQPVLGHGPACGPAPGVSETGSKSGRPTENGGARQGRSQRRAGPTAGGPRRRGNGTLRREGRLMAGAAMAHANPVVRGSASGPVGCPPRGA